MNPCEHDCGHLDCDALRAGWVPRQDETLRPPWLRDEHALDLYYDTIRDLAEQEADFA